MVRAYTDIIALTKLETKEISHKIQINFFRDPIFLQSAAVHDSITKQRGDPIYLVCKHIVENDLSKKNIIIQ
jgi:hypothetical protein